MAYGRIELVSVAREGRKCHSRARTFSQDKGERSYFS